MENSAQVKSNYTTIDGTFMQLFRYKWLIAIGTFLSACIAVAIALKQPNEYTAKVILMPVDSQEGGGLSQLAGQFGGLASMAGISLGGAQGSDIEAALAFMKSRGFLQPFIERRELLPELLALKGWDEKKETLIYDPEIYDSENKKWLLVDKDGELKNMKAWDGFESLLFSFQVSHLKKKGIVELEVTTLSPELSKDILTWLVKDLNEFWKLRDTKKSSNTIEYLQDKANETNVSELRTMFYELIAEQTRNKLLSSVSEFYLLEPLSPPVYPEQKSGPSKALICVAITFLGGLLSMIIALILALRSNSDKS
ncbi:Wzz/FepE/Etk N-terminal domain-containing protein [Pseudoalteromonas citrea]|nr:Wzz/FepE/Etk N-terminal domain-containing protein [Pseudoalteromonas citrea]